MKIIQKWDFVEKKSFSSLLRQSFYFIQEKRDKKMCQPTDELICKYFFRIHESVDKYKVLLIFIANSCQYE